MHELTMGINFHAEPHSFSHNIQGLRLRGGIVDSSGVFRNVQSILRNKVLK